MNHMRFEKNRRLPFLSLLVLFVLCISGCGEKAAELPPATETETPVYREFLEGTADDVLIPVETESEEIEREADVLDLSRLKQYPIWYADYEDIPQSPYWFSMLQYAEDGTAPEVEGIVDLNIRFQKK